MSDTTEPTELDLLVGSIFTTRPEEDRELFEEEREWLSDIQDMLREEGVEADLLSQPGAEVWEGGIERFMDLYQLRLMAAYLEQGRDIAPVLTLPEDQDGEPDEALVAIWEGEKQTRFANLINHQADGGYYLPIDFAEPLWLEVEVEEEDEEELDDDDKVVSFGSSVGLQRELAELATLLQGAGVPTSSPAMRCLTVLKTAADQSVANGLPIIVW
ncbi:MAG: hypothetical protein H7Z42_20735 [Roseiflexaceae bacterium]|nr:hypothetical protein [Roseiflexaceae bacterium]